MSDGLLIKPESGINGGWWAWPPQAGPPKLQVSTSSPEMDEVIRRWGGRRGGWGRGSNMVPVMAHPRRGRTGRGWGGLLYLPGNEVYGPPREGRGLGRHHSAITAPSQCNEVRERWNIDEVISSCVHVCVCVRAGTHDDSESLNPDQSGPPAGFSTASPQPISSRDQTTDADAVHFLFPVRGIRGTQARGFRAHLEM